jgi:hypothetical protein
MTKAKSQRTGDGSRKAEVGDQNGPWPRTSQRDVPAMGAFGGLWLGAKTSWTVNAKTWRTLLSVVQLNWTDAGGLVFGVD